MSDSIEHARRVAAERLRGLQMMGVTQLPRKKSSPAAAEPIANETLAHEPVATQAAPSDSSLSVIQSEVAACTACNELATTRTQTVFGVGDPNARLCFLGEAPGADEDRQGEPFVGRAGKLLTDIIEKGMQLNRSDVYILNVLKCRPPGNRNPLPAEVQSCRGFLNRQLALIKPEFICCLGAVAAQTLLETDEPIGRLRGAFHEYQGIRVLCTYHPAYLLRNPPAKRFVWEDLQVLMQEMGMPVG